MAEIYKDIEKEVVDIARVLRPHIKTQRVISADTGSEHDTKRIVKTVIMDGTEKVFIIQDQYAFNDPKSVVVTLESQTNTNLRGEMVGGNKFRIKADDSDEIAVGTVDSATATTIVDSILAAKYAADDYFIGATVSIIAGTGSSQSKTVTDYTGASGTVTPAAWGVTPDNTSKYKIVKSNSGVSNIRIKVLMRGY